MPPLAGTGVEGPPPISVTRQPIFGADLEICGYEVFFRTNQAPNLFEFGESDLAKVAGHHPAFINLTQDFIQDGHCEALPRDRVVLEILEDVRPDPAVLAELTRLSKLGYRIALDDFVFRAGQVPLVHLADIIKVDLLATDLTMVEDLVATLRRYDVQLLAEKIETSQALQFARDLGFDYLQGFFLSRPGRVLV